MHAKFKIGSALHNLVSVRIVQRALKRMRFAVLSALMLCAMLPPAVAQEVNGFRSPSGNIHCQFSGGDDPTIRCDLREMSNRPPPRPADCDLDWGKAFEISANAAGGIRLCYGDTVQDAGLPVLPYGRTFSRERILCTSTEQGVECRNSKGYGFLIARASQRLF
jgi:hypothetical protein